MRRYTTYRLDLDLFTVSDLVFNYVLCDGNKCFRLGLTVSMISIRLEKETVRYYFVFEKKYMIVNKLLPFQNISLAALDNRHGYLNVYTVMRIYVEGA